MPPVLFTIGYEQHGDPGSLLSALVAADVELVVDVRDLPMSRRRGFSKKALAQAIEEAGITYAHQRALGNPKPYRDLYRSGDQASGERLYRSHVRNGSSWAIDWLSQALVEHRTCVLCYERDPAVCHRAIIVEELRERLPSLVTRHL